MNTVLMFSSCDGVLDEADCVFLAHFRNVPGYFWAFAAPYEPSLALYLAWDPRRTAPA